MAGVSDIVQMNYQNPHASMPLVIPVQVICNTPDDELFEHIRVNSARDLDWVGFRPAHDGVAIMCGGGPSLAEHLDEISYLWSAGGDIFAMNGASVFLGRNWIPVDYQVIADAKQETASLVDRGARAHLFASQVHPDTIDAIRATLRRPQLWHLHMEGMEDHFPAERRQRGGYALVGGGAAVGNSALCLAYVMGYRRFEVFGYDSSHRGEASHAYDQPMNRFIPVAEVEWGGRTYRSSVAMKAQAEKFQITGQALVQQGCTINVHGDGLLPAMWNTQAADLTERDKYRLMWRTDSYREVSPGADAVPTFLEVVKPDGLILDFGCGTGRAALALHDAGHDVLLIDFADNCRDEEAAGLPFLEWDLTRELPPRAPYGLCCDVMEHIPPESVDTVIRNIMGAARGCFFQISTVPDEFGAMLGTSLHLTVKPAWWWRAQFLGLGYRIAWSASDKTSCQFYVLNKEPD